MTLRDLCLAHQGLLRYIHVNNMACDPCDFASMLVRIGRAPGTMSGQEFAVIIAIARNLGRNVTSADASRIAAYVAVS